MGIDVKKFVLVNKDTEKKVASYGYEDKDVFHNHLKEAGISKDTYSKVQHAEKAYADDVVTASAELAIKEFKRDKNLEVVTSKMPFRLRGSLTTKVTRNDEVRNVQTGEVSIQPTLRVKAKESIASGKVIKELKEKLVKDLAK